MNTENFPKQDFSTLTKRNPPTHPDGCVLSEVYLLNMSAIEEYKHILEVIKDDIETNYNEPIREHREWNVDLMDFIWEKEAETKKLLKEALELKKRYDNDPSKKWVKEELEVEESDSEEQLLE